MTGLRDDQLTRCHTCGRGLAESVPVFYRVTLEQHVVNLGAVQRRVGLAAMMGGSDALAGVFAPDREYSHQLFTTTALLCQPCVLDRSKPIVSIWPDGDQAG